MNQGLTSLIITAYVFVVLGVGSAHAIPLQRVNTCVVMDVTEGRVQGKQYSWEFELKVSGNYVVQLITPIYSAEDDPAVRVTVNGNALDDALSKVYLIEDGIVWQSRRGVTLKAGRHSLSIHTELMPTMARLASEAYEKKRIHTSSSKYYTPWLAMHQSPEKQAALARFKEYRFGMFIHWGVYSVAAGRWKGVKIEKSPIRGPRVAEWLMYSFNIPRAEYREFARQFNPDTSFAANIARLAKDTGMKYVVITAKHHDGFALFDSPCSDWDVTDACPYEGDLIKELYEACLAVGLEFGVYYSHGHDWTDGTDANYAKVKKIRDAMGVPTRPNGKNLYDPSPNAYADYLEGKAYPQIAELIRLMPDLSLIWFDGEGLITEAQAFRFYKLIYDLNPNILVNRRIGYDFGDYVDAGDNTTWAADELAFKRFETCGTGNRSWGYKAHDHRWKSVNQLLRNFLDILSKEGNYLLNIGPDGKGHVPEPCVKNFTKMGEWIRTNSEAIFGTVRWSTYCEGVGDVKSPTSLPAEFWFTRRPGSGQGTRVDTVYAMSLVPGAGQVKIRSLKRSAGIVTNLRLLGSYQHLTWTQNEDALEIDFTGVRTGSSGYAVAVTLNQPVMNGVHE